MYKQALSTSATLLQLPHRSERKKYNNKRLLHYALKVRVHCYKVFWEDQDYNQNQDSVSSGGDKRTGNLKKYHTLKTRGYYLLSSGFSNILKCKIQGVFKEFSRHFYWISRKIFHVTRELFKIFMTPSSQHLSEDLRVLEVSYPEQAIS